MKVSKISRSLIVAIFVVSISYIIYIGFDLILKSNFKADNIIRISYVGILFLLTYGYGYIKSKFSKKRIKRNVSLIYRYTYIIIITIGSKLFYILNEISDMSVKRMLINVLIMTFVAIIVKKIIYNISKSDILSVFGMLAYAIYPVIGMKHDMFTNSNLIVLITMISIFLIQILIDELKQIGIKNKKYIILTIFLSVLIIVSLIIGVNSIIWIFSAIIMLFITNNLDRANVNFPKILINKLPQNQKERLYKIERIYLGKLIIVILLSIIITTIVYSSFRLFDISNITNIRNNVISVISTIFKSNINIMFNNIKLIISSSKMFYIVLCSYIIFIEILTVLLKRRYDTKSTLIKSLFLIILFIYSIINIDLILYYNLLTVLLIIIAVISTSNLYLNREERVKLLKA